MLCPAHLIGGPEMQFFKFSCSWSAASEIRLCAHTHTYMIHPCSSTSSVIFIPKHPLSIASYTPTPTPTPTLYSD